MSALYYYRHIIGDYDRDTKELTLLEHGVYRRLMDAYYGNRGPLAAEPTNLYRVTSAVLPDEQAAVRKIAYLFFDLENGMLRHGKCDKEIARVTKESEAQAARSRKRWEPPKENNGDHAGGLPPDDPAAYPGTDAGVIPKVESGTSPADPAPPSEQAESGANEADSAVFDPPASPPAVPRVIPSHSHSHIKAKERAVDSPSGEPVKRFIPPSIEEVHAYCTERKNDVSAARFVTFYESKGWLVGRARMKDWKAAVRTWEVRNLENKRAAVESRNKSTAHAWADSHEDV